MADSGNFIYPEYCVVIRTLGKAGDKYMQELQSLARQTLQPKRILVYIAEGYSIPSETIEREEYIRCPKGMMTQRSLPFKEVDTEWILFLDDDIWLPDDGVEKLFDGVLANGGDCIAPATYKHEKLSFYHKLLMATLSQTYPHFYKEWAFRIRKDGGYSYNIHPEREVLCTQSAPGTCCLCKTSAYHGVKMADERWIDSFHYPIGEDMLFYYKMYLLGYKVLIHFSSGVIHLDAHSAHHSNLKDENLEIRTLRFVNWWRTVYSIQQSKWRKIECFVLFTIRTCFSTACHFVFALLKRKVFYATNMIKGVWKGWKYVHSEEYMRYPMFIHFINIR
jgi:glycosyltransferase involved in cell wall biosynthesis